MTKTTCKVSNFPIPKVLKCILVDIAVEYVSGGSIRALLDKFHTLEEKVVKSYTLQILEGLAYLHSAGIVHRYFSIFFLNNIFIEISKEPIY